MTFLHSLTLAAFAGLSPAPDILAIRVGRAETIAQGTLEHAVIVVEDGVIKAVGQDLEVERGIPVLDRPDWVAMPGLVNCYSRIGMDSQGSSSSTPQVRASSELYARQDVWDDVLAAGITTLGLYPAGNGIPGQAVAVRPAGDDAEDMVLADRVYLKILLRAESRSKDRVRDGFEEADEYEEDEREAREKYEKKLERQKKKAKRKKDKDDDEKEEKEGEDDEELGPYEPPEPDEDVAPFLALRDGSLKALFAIRKAADLVHLLDVLEGEDISWDLRVPLRRESDLYEVVDRIREAGCRVVVEPSTTWQVTTRRDRNLPQELSAAGVPVVLIPHGDSLSSQERWLHDVANIVRFGLDRGTALRAVTLEPAELLGLGERLGSLEPGKDANLVFFDGDPLDPASRLRAVMLEGRFAVGEENL